VKWINLAQDRNKWRGLINTVTNPYIHEMGRGSTEWTVYCNHLDWVTAGFITQYLLQSPHPVSVLIWYSVVTTGGREANKPQ